MLWRRRRCLPLQTGRTPWVRSCGAAAFDRPDEINERQQISDAQNGCACCRENIENLKLRRIRVIAPWHSEIAHDELRKERQIKSEKSGQGRQLSPDLRIQTARYLRPPIMQTAHERGDHPSDHDVMEVRHNEVRVGHMNIHCERGKK